jgi:8-oxo-dGTP pyrophosphatase MutT (NUDIX family)
LKATSSRTSVRVVLIDPDDRVLLLAIRDPDDGRIVWFVPGGGVEPGESLEETARRELAEEIGLTEPVVLQGPVWIRNHVFTWNGRRITQEETFFLCRLATSISEDRIRPTGQEGDFFQRAR